MTGHLDLVRVSRLASSELSRSARSVTSQFGEDGILEALFLRLGVETGLFCEFGAYDGITMSNTYQLFLRGWRGIFIEGMEDRFRDLERNVGGDRSELLRLYVAADGSNSLDALFARSRFADEIAREGLHLLSIDIDSDDLALWRSLATVRPWVVVIEYNGAIPLDVYFQNPPGRSQGNSALAIFEHARSIGYKLVANTESNLVFLDERAPGAERVDGLELHDMDTTGAERFFFAFDGTLLHHKDGTVVAHEYYKVPWQPHFLFQPVPRAFRSFGRPPLARAFSIALGALQSLVAHPVSALKAYAAQARRQRSG